MRIDKTCSELWNLVNDHEDETVRNTARMAINALQKLQEENRRLQDNDNPYIKYKRSGKMKNRKNEMVWNKELGIYVLPKAEEKGLKNVLVFKVCEYELVVAHSLDEAIEWYKVITGFGDDELYNRDEIEIVPFEREVWNDEYEARKITVREIVNNYWNGEPFIITAMPKIVLRK